MNILKHNELLMEKSIKIDFFLLKKTAIILRALNHLLRQQIFNLLEENGKMTVSEIYGKLHLEQSVASQHLAIMRRAGIVKTEKEEEIKEQFRQVRQQIKDYCKKFIADNL